MPTNAIYLHGAYIKMLRVVNNLKAVQRLCWQAVDSLRRAGRAYAKAYETTDATGAAAFQNPTSVARSASVATMVLTAHKLSAGEWFLFDNRDPSSKVTGWGITLLGMQQVSEVVDENTVKFICAGDDFGAGAGYAGKLKCYYPDFSLALAGALAAMPSSFTAPLAVTYENAPGLVDSWSGGPPKVPQVAGIMISDECPVNAIALSGIERSDVMVQLHFARQGQRHNNPRDMDVFFSSITGSEYWQIFKQALLVYSSLVRIGFDSASLEGAVALYDALIAEDARNAAVEPYKTFKELVIDTSMVLDQFIPTFPTTWIPDTPAIDLLLAVQLFYEKKWLVREGIVDKQPLPLVGCPAEDLLPWETDPAP